jgi:hypothetical protein
MIMIGRTIPYEDNANAVGAAVAWGTGKLQMQSVLMAIARSR